MSHPAADMALGLRCAGFEIVVDAEVDDIVVGAAQQGHPGAFAVDGPAAQVLVLTGAVVFIQVQGFGFGVEVQAVLPVGF